MPVPEAEDAIAHLRQLHDPQAEYGVPAHITLLYPFAHPSVLANTTGALQHFFDQVQVFDFSLTEIRRFPTTAYLHPEPSETFIRLTETLAQRWPEYPPYGGSFATVIPHLTIADAASIDVLDAVARDMIAHLPIRCRATQAWLMCSDEQGFWSRREAFPFRSE